jgi:hypothetical protein
MLLSVCHYEKHNCKHLFSIADMKLNMMDFFFYVLTVTLISVTVLCWKPQCNMVFCDLNFVLQNTVLNLHNYLLLCQSTGMTFFN